MPVGISARIALDAETIWLMARSILTVRLKENLFDCHARQRLAFYITDIADIGADGIFAVGGDALFHFLRSQAGVLPNHRHDGNIDVRENILWRCDDRAAAEKQHHQGQHIKCVTITKGESDNPHDSLQKPLVTYCLVQYISRQEFSAHQVVMKTSAID